MSYEALFLPAVEAEMRAAVDRIAGPRFAGLRAMLAYHLGWEGEGAGPKARGKRVRPLLLLLTTVAAGGDWEKAVPAAAAVELVHNFSLIHDDIQDRSDTRRGRPTVWRQWGVAQAINAGDAMYTLAFAALSRLRDTVGDAQALEAHTVMQNTCLRLIEGQYLDLAYEQRADLNEEDYWPMVGGKTAALLAACTDLGALVAGAPEAVRSAYRRFGEGLGLAFQVQDDELGIWGDAALTGKPTGSDLLEGKNTLPVLYGLAHSPAFAQRWRQGPPTPDEVPHLTALLETCGAREYTRRKAAELTEQALGALEEAQPQGEAGEALRALALKLLERKA